MKSVFATKKFIYPYENLKFPGQHSEEKILFITREGPLVIKLKSFTLFASSIITFIIGLSILAKSQFFGYSVSFLIPIFVIFCATATFFAFWWLTKLYQKSIFIITTRRLTKFIHTTPWTRYQMSLGLDKIVDTGAYKKGFLQMVTGYGYFVARSAAGAIKNFKIINISFAEDLHNYVNKLLFIFSEKDEKLDKFRPFIPHLKGEKRDSYVRKVTPKYAKPKKESK
jgi:hypothetical protein